jgi:hypothetical protein
MDDLNKSFNEIKIKTEIIINDNIAAKKSFDKSKLQSLVEKTSQELYDKYCNLIY